SLAPQTRFEDSAVGDTPLALHLYLLRLLLHLGLPLIPPLEPAHHGARGRSDLRALAGCSRRWRLQRRPWPLLVRPLEQRTPPSHGRLGGTARCRPWAWRVRVVPRLRCRPLLALHLVRRRLLGILSRRRVGLLIADGREPGGGYP